MEFEGWTREFGELGLSGPVQETLGSCVQLTRVKCLRINIEYVRIKKNWTMTNIDKQNFAAWLVPAGVSDWESERWEAAKETEEEEKESKGH